MQTKKLGRPREWVLNEEIIETRRFLTELPKKNLKANLSDIKDMLRTELEQRSRDDLLPKLDKILDLMKQVIPFPPRCICGNRVYSYTCTKIEREIFARCVNPNCRFLRRYLPSASYKWSRPEPAFKELPPTFYEMDGQLVEEPK